MKVTLRERSPEGGSENIAISPLALCMVPKALG